MPIAAVSDPEINPGSGSDDGPEASRVEPSEDTSVVTTTAALVRRAELQIAAPLPAPATSSATFLALQCAELSVVGGQLNGGSNQLSSVSFVFLYDTFVVTARRTGKVSIASSVLPIGDSYQYGYGYPLSAQAVEESDGEPSLSPSLVAHSALLDNALDDGEARLELDVEAGKQYLVTYKGLVGSASLGSAWSYELGICAADLSVEGRLWVSADAEDLVPLEPLHGPISTANAPTGAMGRLATELEVTP
jgi:hypothetical protein